MILTLLTCLLALLLGTNSVSADDTPDQPAWDDFGVAMSQDEHAQGSGAVHFGGGGSSLRLTPRPVVVPGVENPAVELDGTWYSRSHVPADFATLSESDVADWDRVDVPGDYRMLGKGGGTVAYVRFFTVPADWRGRRVKLRCDEIASDAKVWVNGSEVGQHVGHFIAFELDITEAVRFGEKNCLAIRVKSDSIARRVSGYALHVGGGITRSIRVFTVPETNLARMHVTTDLDEQYRDALLKLHVHVANQSAADSGPVSLAIDLIAPQGKQVEIERSPLPLEPVPAGKTLARTLSIPVAEPAKWDAEHPNLYRLRVTLTEGGQARQTLERRIGFREIEVRGRQLLVNGTPVKLRGSCRHLAHPQRGRSSTPELARLDAELFKRANCNFIRTSHYPPSEEFITACDEVGLYVEEEAPFCFFNHNPTDKQLRAEDVARYCTYANLKMVERDLSHPSVVIWSIANESHWGPHFEAAAKAVARMDPSRPRTFMWFPRDNDVLNIAASHYPGPEDVYRTDPNRPMLFSEYCHLPAYVPHEMFTDPGVEDQWGPSLTLTWNNLYRADGALGGAVWCGIDDDFHLPPVDQTEGYQMRGVARWGILDGWRRPKPEYWHVLKSYSPVKVTAAAIELTEDDNEIRIPVENRYDFTNFGELDIVWQLDEKKGKVVADVAPRTRGVLRISDIAARPGQTLRIKATDASGRLVDEYALPLVAAGKEDQEPSETNRGRDDGDEPWQLTEEDDSLLIRRGNVAVRIDRRTGKIADSRIGDQQVLCGGPHWSFIPTFSKHQQVAMKGETPRLTPGYGANWKCDTVAAEQSDREVLVHVKGAYDEAALDCVYRFRPDGTMDIEYTSRLGRAVVGQGDVCFIGSDPSRPDGGDFVAFVRFREDGKAEVRRRAEKLEPFAVAPEKLQAVPRQMGMRFELPRTVDTLHWNRNAEWSVYPDDHIGRAHGTATAFVPGLDTRELPGREPTWPWSLAASELGTRDFRSTKRNIKRAALTDADGYGLQVVSDGTQHTRAYVAGDQVQWLIADVDNGPSERFMQGYCHPLRRPVPLDEPVRGVVRCRFVAGSE